MAMAMSRFMPSSALRSGRIAPRPGFEDAFCMRWTRAALGSFDQGSRQTERPAQYRLFARHFTIIALMVKACQMKDSVQRQDLDFLGHGVTEAEGVFEGDIGGDRDFAGQLRSFARLRGS